MKFHESAAVDFDDINYNFLRTRKIGSIRKLFQLPMLLLTSCFDSFPFKKLRAGDFTATIEMHEISVTWRATFRNVNCLRHAHIKVSFASFPLFTCTPRGVDVCVMGA